MLHRRTDEPPPSPSTGNNRLRLVDAAPEPPRPLKTVAGSGAQSPFIDNAPSLAATVVSPAYVATLPNGDVVFTDAAHFTVRSVSYGGGSVARVAGTSGVSGFVGGSALAARLGRPAGICVPYYSADTIFFAGTCLSRCLSRLCCDQFGAPVSIPLTDTANNVVWAFSRDTGNITVVAGTGATTQDLFTSQGQAGERQDTGCVRPGISRHKLNTPLRPLPSSS